MKRKYKTFGYNPRHKYKYYIYNKEGIFIDTFDTIPEICERLHFKENSIRVMFYKKKTKEIKHKDVRIFREKGKFKYE
jgi:hypothetical protein